MWLDWQACQVDTPNWWKELITIPNVGDAKRLAWKFCTSFKVQMPDPQGPQRVYCASCTKMHPVGYVPVRCQLPPALSGLLAETTVEDHDICTGTSILGREGLFTSAQWTSPFGNVHTWIKVAYEKIHNLQWPWCFWGPNVWVTWSGSWGDHPA